MTQISGIPALTPTSKSTVNRVNIPAGEIQPTQSKLDAVSHALLLTSHNGSAVQTLNFLPSSANWSKKEQALIQTNFQKGLKQYKITENDLNTLLQRFQINYVSVNKESVVNSDYAENIKLIQSVLNKRLAPLKGQQGKGFTIPVTGKFDQKTMLGLLALRDTLRGPAIKLSVDPIPQIGSKACYHASSAMFFNAVHHKTGQQDAYNEKDYAVRISVQDLKATSAFAGVISENARGKLTVDRHKSIQMLDYIDKQLNDTLPKPVIIGVSSRKQEAGSEYNEGITDHFVLLTGRGYDQEGLFYTFNDPFAGGGDFKFRLDPFTGKLYGTGDSERRYDVSMAKAYTVDSGTVEYYKHIGKPVLNPGAKGKAVLALQKQLQQLGFINVKLTQKYDAAVLEAVKQVQSDNNLPVTGRLDSYTQNALNK